MRRSRLGCREGTENTSRSVACSASRNPRRLLMRNGWPVRRVVCPLRVRRWRSLPPGERQPLPLGRPRPPRASTFTPAQYCRLGRWQSSHSYQPPARCPGGPRTASWLIALRATLRGPFSRLSIHPCACQGLAATSKHARPLTLRNPNAKTCQFSRPFATHTARSAIVKSRKDRKRRLGHPLPCCILPHRSHDGYQQRSIRSLGTSPPRRRPVRAIAPDPTTGDAHL